MASRPAEGDDRDRRRQRRTEVEQVLLHHPDIVQAFVVGVPEIVAAPVELRGRAPTDPRARRDLPPKAAAPRLATAGAVPPCEKQTAPVPCSLPAAPAEGDDCRGIPAG